MTLKHRIYCAAIGVVEKAVGTVLEKSEWGVLLIGIPDMNRESSGDPDKFTIC